MIKPEQICEFLKLNSCKHREWAPEKILEFVQYYMRMGGLGIIQDKGEIVGIGAARTLDLLHVQKQFKDPWHFSHYGDVLYVSTICVTKTRAIPVLWNMMLEQFGYRPFFAGERHGKLRLWNLKKYQNRLGILKG